MQSLGDIFTTTIDGQPRLKRALSLSEAAAYVARTPPNPDKGGKRPAPFSIRLSSQDRTRLEGEAAGVPLGAYMKQKLLGAPPVRTRRVGLAVRDQQALAQLVAILGRSRVFESLSEMTALAKDGALSVSPDTVTALQAALTDIRAVRTLLLEALGLKPDGAKAMPANPLEDA